jgi:predicted nucleic acid-binding protein
VTGPTDAVVVDTNASGWLLEGRHHPLGDGYRELINGRRVIVPFQVVAEIRYGMLRARWGELRVRRTEGAIAKLSVAQPDDQTVFRYAELRSWAAEGFAPEFPAAQKIGILHKNS